MHRLLVKGGRFSGAQGRERLPPAAGRELLRVVAPPCTSFGPRGRMPQVPSAAGTI